jgi:hypothetical protein
MAPVLPVFLSIPQVFHPLSWPRPAPLTFSPPPSSQSMFSLASGRNAYLSVFPVMISRSSQASGSVLIPVVLPFLIDSIPKQLTAAYVDMLLDRDPLISRPCFTFRQSFLRQISELRHWMFLQSVYVAQLHHRSMQRQMILTSISE